MALASPRMNTSPPAIPRSLFAFSIFYGGMVCIAGVLGNKQVALGPLAVEAGIFAFLVLVVTSSAVAELHGSVWANRLVRIGFVADSRGEGTGATIRGHLWAGKERLLLVDGPYEPFYPWHSWGKYQMGRFAGRPPTP